MMEERMMQIKGGEPDLEPQDQERNNILKALKNQYYLYQKNSDNLTVLFIRIGLLTGVTNDHLRKIDDFVKNNLDTMEEPPQLTEN